MIRATAALLLAIALLSRASATAADVPPSRSSDLERARSGYVENSLALSAAARVRASRFIDAKLPKVEAMSREEFVLCVMPITGFADNGHDGLNDEEGAWFPGSRLPLRMIWFADGWVVARAAPEQAELLGARVLNIEGMSPAAMVARLRRFVGGIDAYRRWDGEWLIENAGMLHAMGVAKNADALRLELRLRDGRHVVRTVPFAPGSSMPPGAGPVRVWLPELLPGEADKGWRAAIAAPAPLYLEEGMLALRAKALPELASVYVQFRSHFDSPEETIDAFTHRVDALIAQGKPRHLIVDLRFDTGGNSDLTRDWVKEVVTRVPGTLYLLTGPYTFSAGIVTAGAFKHDGASRVRIVGDGVGDRLRWSSEGRNECLPFSHYCPHVTTGTWDLVRGCAGEPGCYGDRYAVTVGTLAPDLVAPLTAQAWLAGRDPALEAVRAEIAGH